MGKEFLELLRPKDKCFYQALLGAAIPQTMLTAGRDIPSPTFDCHWEIQIGQKRRPCFLAIASSRISDEYAAWATSEHREVGLANTAGAESDLVVGKISIPTLQERQGELSQHARG